MTMSTAVGEMRMRMTMPRCWFRSNGPNKPRRWEGPTYRKRHQRIHKRLSKLLKKRIPVDPKDEVDVPDVPRPRIQNRASSPETDNDTSSDYSMSSEDAEIHGFLEKFGHPLLSEKRTQRRPKDIALI